MGLFDSILGQVGDAVSGGASSGHGGLMDAVTGLINNPETGGLNGLIDSFKEKGMGDSIASWIGTGHNLPISAEQIHSVLGNEQVQAIAQKLGISTGEASNGLASMLPQLIDRLTPNGEVPEGGLLEQGLAMLKGFGKPT